MLPPQPVGGAEGVSPRQVATRLWGGLLGVDAVAPGDDWYALGGDSLLTTRIITLLEQRYRVPLPVDRFFNATTAAAMAAALADALPPSDAVATEGDDADRGPQILPAQIEASSRAGVESPFRRGGRRTYPGLAAAMGEPRATRAVARACAQNKVSIAVPCHRVVGKDGDLTGYRWGVARKRALLAGERAARRG